MAKEAGKLLLRDGRSGSQNGVPEGCVTPPTANRFLPLNSAISHRCQAKNGPPKIALFSTRVEIQNSTQPTPKPKSGQRRAPFLPTVGFRRFRFLEHPPVAPRSAFQDATCADRQRHAREHVSNVPRGGATVTGRPMKPNKPQNSLLQSRFSPICCGRWLKIVLKPTKLSENRPNVKRKQHYLRAKIDLLCGA